MVAAIELGLTTFAELTDPAISPGERIRQVVEEAKLAEQVGLDVYGIGEHHRPDMAASAPEIILAAIAGATAGSSSPAPSPCSAPPTRSAHSRTSSPSISSLPAGPS